MSQQARYWLEKIHALDFNEKVKIMNVCGGHERSLSMAGIRGVLPKNIELIPGPGCPVCVCPEEDLYLAIQLAITKDICLVAFGDMLHVPVNAPKNEARSLQQAKAKGADIRAIASPQEAVSIAHAAPQKQIVFFVAGFETTTAPVISMLAEDMPDNLLLLLAARRTWPAVEMLLQSDTCGFDGLIAPGHVATIMGTSEWSAVAKEYHKPVAIAGFDSDSLLAAIYSIIRQLQENHNFLDNCYGSVASLEGNTYAQQLLNYYTDIDSAIWRGIGSIPNSGFELKKEFQQWDAKSHFPAKVDFSRKRLGKMPAGCDCAQVVLGKIYPNECHLYGKACQPRNPVGPCMVSDEGACRIWWTTQKNHRHTSASVA